VSDVNYPSGLAVDAAGDLLIADSYDRSIRDVPAHTGTLFGRPVTADDMYTAAGLLTTGGSVPLGDGTRWILTRVTYPDGVALGPGGALYFTDEGGNTVRRISDS
jgi:DNA-binding beta-propeller fold protein YncE